MTTRTKIGVAFGSVALAAALTVVAHAQSASDANAQVRPGLDDQIGFGPGRPHNKPRPKPVRPARPDHVQAITIHCGEHKEWLNEAIERLNDNGTLTIEGSGPACTLTGPLRITHSVRVFGLNNAAIVGPSAGPCVYVAGSTPNGTWPAITIENVTFHSFSDYRSGCIRSDNANLTLNFVDIDASGVDVLTRGGRLTVSGGRLKGGEDNSPALVVLGSEFTISRTKFDTVGSPIYIEPAASGPATLANIELVSKGRDAFGIRLRRHPQTPWGSLVVLDRVRVTGFDRGIIVGERVRAVVSDAQVNNSGISGIDVNGALTMTGTRIMDGATGIRIGHTSGRARIEDNYIVHQGVSGLDVRGTAPTIVRDNVFVVRGGNCFTGERAKRFKDDNRCHEWKAAPGAPEPDWENEGPPRHVAYGYRGDAGFDAAREEANMASGRNMDDEPGHDKADDDTYPDCVVGVDDRCRPWDGTD